MAYGIGSKVGFIEYLDKMWLLLFTSAWIMRGEKGTWPGNVAQFGGAVVQRVGQY